ncbi:MAG: 50S ribosomal protein L3 N(5)-glutamine methyltransferase [Gammaproteobacteria bacterium]
MNARELAADLARRLESAGVHFGHGTDNAPDEALFLVLHALGWGYEVSDAALERPLDAAALAAVEKLAAARIGERQPAAYLTGRMWFAGHEFAVDRRALVPRSPLAELIGEGFRPWLGAAPRRILDIGTGSGCIAIACALEFPQADVVATDLSAAALALAALNVRRHDVGARVSLREADVFPKGEAPFDLIVANPPYVPSARMDSLPAEYAAEPRLGLEAGADGLDVVRRILAGAAAWLRPGGLLVVEVGEVWPALEQAYPALPFTWVEFEHGGEGVFVLEREALAGAGHDAPA